jgi:hypothetical protein
MEEDYREKLVSVSLSETSEQPLDEPTYTGITSYCKRWCKKLNYILKFINTLFCCFSQGNKKKI